MSYFVVQWIEEEGQVSTVSGKDVLGTGRVGENVSVILRIKGQAEAHKAPIL